MCYVKLENEVDSLADADEGQNSNAPVEKSRSKRVRAVWGIGHRKRKMHQRAAKYKKETPTDKAARRTATATVWMAVFTFVLVAVAGGTLVILRNQLREMHEGGTQTDKIIKAANLIEGHQKQMVTDNKQVLSDNKTALEGTLRENRNELGKMLQQNRDALEANIAQGKRVLDANIEASRGDQRAWLGASDNTYTLAATGPIESSVTVTNSGKSPAIDILCRITGTTTLKAHVFSDSDIVYPSDLPILKQGTIFPAQHFPLKAGGDPMDVTKQEQWFEKVKSGEFIQYFFGEVRYRDAFGTNHWSHFCSQFVPTTKSGTPCPVYNDTDDSNRK